MSCTRPRGGSLDGVASQIARGCPKCRRRPSRTMPPGCTSILFRGLRRPRRKRVLEIPGLVTMCTVSSASLLAESYSLSRLSSRLSSLSRDRVVSCRVVSCRVVSCRVVSSSCRVVSSRLRVVFVSSRLRLFSSRVVSRITSYRIFLYPIVSYRIVSCLLV